MKGESWQELLIDLDVVIDHDTTIFPMPLMAEFSCVYTGYIAVGKE
jgi:hypothetical protein